MNGGQLDFEYLAIVAEKMAAVTRRSAEEYPANEDIRKLSIDLRFLLCDGHLQRAWKSCGFPKEPLVVVPAFLAKDDASSNAAVVLGGGVRIGGMEVGGFRYHRRALSDEEIRANYEKEKDAMNASPVQIGLRAFLDGRKVIVDGKAMTRRQVIKYVANKLGGAHFDHQGREPGVEAVRGSFRFMGKDPVLLEVLAYGQQLSNSPDFAALRTKLESTLSSA